MFSLYKSYSSKGMSSTAEGKGDFLTQLDQVYRKEPRCRPCLWIRRLQFKAQHKDTAQYQDTKTGRIAPDIRKTLDLRKVLNIRKILLLLDDRSGTH